VEIETTALGPLDCPWVRVGKKPPSMGLSAYESQGGDAYNPLVPQPIGHLRTTEEDTWQIRVSMTGWEELSPLQRW
jgi:hypothetical protein